MLPGVTYKSLMATLWQHPNGTFYIRHGKGRVSLKTKDERKANLKFNNWLRDRSAGRQQESVLSIRLHKFVEAYLDYADVNYPASTYDLYRQAGNKMKASWGNIPVKDISPRHIDSLITDMKRSGIAPATINKNYRHAKSMLRKAIEWGYMQPIKFPKQVREERHQRYIPEKDLKRLLAAIKDDEFKRLCLFAVYSGLRSGELVRLAWNDVDNPEGFLRITAKQKNKTESRIPINPVMRGVLDKQGGREKVFRFATIYRISHLFKKSLTDAGIPQYRFHDLRHSYGSYLAMQGYPPKTIKELLRHRSIASTMGYLDLSPEHLKEASDGFRLDIE